MLPCVGAGITVEIKRKFGDRPVLRRAYVTGHGPSLLRDARGQRIDWKSGAYVGEVWEGDENKTWCYGHGDRARNVFCTVRALSA